MKHFFSDKLIIGRVVHGRQLGRELGFPTANIELNDTFLDIRGVFLARMRGGLNGYWAMVNIGERPSVEQGGGARIKAEVSILDFEGDLYGHTIEFSLVEKLRNEVQFDSLSDLKSQLNRDRNRSLELITQIEKNQQ